ncbi:hypothetical protein KSP39_PZI004349 [Platanthera zijinensis]|uniref:Reverse transcriptase Ty1/copia-type domain-containing protein n=1 Tax=Platanthera zijinensis TaxID=2320716 RepID=A0AAP0BWB0_9ASPA
MSPQVYRSYMLLDFAYEMWKRARDTYSQKGSSTQIYELTHRVLELKQGTMTVSAYYSEFERLYQELDYFNTFTVACTVDAQTLQKDKYHFRVHVFLMGLNMEFDVVRLYVLHCDPLPSLREAFNMLLSDENRRRSFGSSTDHSALTEISRGPLPVCNHCGKKGYIKNVCFRLYPHLAPSGRGSSALGRGGYRGGDRQTGDRTQYSAHSTEVQEDTSRGLSAMELEAFRRLSSAHTASSSPSEWIIDLGATDHMTGSASGFTSYTPLSGHDKVIAANGSLSSIAGKGTIVCSPDLSLSSILHGPSFPRNLLSISHLNTSLNCSITFFPDVCVFQDLDTKQMLGSGRNVDGLYLLDQSLAPSALSSSRSLTLHNIRRWHQRLGHPSALYLTKFLPPGKRTIGLRWIFSVKQNQDGVVERYKARLVAQGYTQTQGIEYQETFAPVATVNSIWVILSYAASRGWELQQFDVKNAFLHGDLEEKVYMTIPPGFIKEEFNGKGCHLQKSLYGLKQFPRALFGRFNKTMLQQGYAQGQADHTLFIKRRGAHVSILFVYVDDIIITRNDLEEIAHLKEQLGREFEIKDLGKLKYFLGIEVVRSRRGIFISQRKYTLDLLVETGMLGCQWILQLRLITRLTQILVGEVGELSEIFMWRGEVERGLASWKDSDKEHLGEELSDVLLYLIRLSDICGIDLGDAANKKIVKNSIKYPASKTL